MRQASDKSASDKSPTAALGFLTVCDLESLGLVGGYLLLNLAGRPLEFHCTAPVRPSRAQEILYGPTLAPFLYGEQIGRALVEKTSLSPLAIVTDCEAAMAVAQAAAAPVALLVGGDFAKAGFHTFDLGPSRVALPVGRRDEADGLSARFQTPGDLIDLAEPFDRIREAIREAHRDAKVKAA